MPHHKPMVTPDFTPPESVTTDRFIVRPPLFSDAEADSKAWSTSIEHLQGIFGPGSDWPTTEMTLDENAINQPEGKLGCVAVAQIQIIQEHRGRGSDREPQSPNGALCC